MEPLINGDSWLFLQHLGVLQSWNEKRSQRRRLEDSCIYQGCDFTGGCYKGAEVEQCFHWLWTLSWVTREVSGGQWAGQDQRIGGPVRLARLLGSGVTRTLFFIKLQSSSLLKISSGLGLHLSPHPCWACLAQFRRIHPSFIIDHPGLPSARILLSLFNRIPLCLVLLLSNFPSTDPLILLVDYKSPGFSALFRVEHILSPLLCLDTYCISPE